MSGSAQRVPNRALITLSVMLGNLMQSLDASIANVSLPYMQGEMSASDDEITWVLTSYVIAAAIMVDVRMTVAGSSSGTVVNRERW